MVYIVLSDGRVILQAAEDPTPYRDIVAIGPFPLCNDTDDA